MSLFTDLREVFTEYAQRIKGLAAADEQIKADLDVLDPGLSDTARAALLACFAHVAWSGTGGRTYYNTLKNALYPEGNLINGIELTWDYGYIDANGELYKSLNGSFTSNYFDVRNFSNYRVNAPSEDWDARRMAFYTASYVFIDRVLTETGEIPSNAVYGRCTVGNLQLSGQTEYDGAGTSILLT